MTPDGSKVYFTSEEHLTARRRQATLAPASTCGRRKGRRRTPPAHPDLQGGSRQRRRGRQHRRLRTGARRDRDNDAAARFKYEELPWTAKCGVLPYSGYVLSRRAGGARAATASPTPPSPPNGDIYFYSPEQLDGDRGVPGQQNLYDYREGRVQFVTTLTPNSMCIPEVFTVDLCRTVCSDGPDRPHRGLPRRQPHGLRHRRPAHLLRQRRPPRDVLLHPLHRRRIVCDSCNPDGQPADRRRRGQPGRPLHDRRRPHLLLHRPNPSSPRTQTKASDVYEFVDGRPQLITPGTGDRRRRRAAAVESPSEIARSRRRQRQRHRRLLLHLRHASSPKTTTATSSSSTTPAPTAASPSPRPPSPAPPPKSATAPAPKPPTPHPGHRRHPHRRQRHPRTAPRHKHKKPSTGATPPSRQHNRGGKSELAAATASRS